MTKISDLTALTGAGVDTATDLLPIVDMSAAGVLRNKKITIDEAKIALDVPAAITELDDVPDVNAPTPTNGDVLTWDSTPGEWVPTAPTTGATTLDGLTDVNTPTPADGDFLMWDATPGEWIPGTPAGGVTDLDDLSDVDLTGQTSGDVLTYDGADWVPQAPSGGGYEAGPPTPPTTADLATWDNQGTSTATDGTGAMILKPQVDGVPHGRYKTAPSTPYDVYCRVELMTLSTGAVTTAMSVSGGILFKDTGGDNERLLIGIQQERISGDEQNTYALLILRWTGASPPVFSAAPVIKYTSSPLKWIRVNNDGTTLTFYASHDGKNWISVGTETLAAFIDAAASFGVASHSSSGSTESAAIFSYFSTTAPA